MQRYGRYVLVSVAELDQADRFFARFGGAAVFIGRLLPLVRTFIALPAGIGHMRQLPFHVFTFAGSFIWCLVLAYLGQQLGARWDSSPALRAFMHRSDLIIVAVALLAAGWFIQRRLRHR